MQVYDFPVCGILSVANCATAFWVRVQQCKNRWHFSTRPPFLVVRIVCCIQWLTGEKQYLTLIFEDYTCAFLFCFLSLFLFCSFFFFIGLIIILSFFWALCSYLQHLQIHFTFSLPDLIKPCVCSDRQYWHSISGVKAQIDIQWRYVRIARWP